MNTPISRMLDHIHWANLEMLDALKLTHTNLEKALSLFIHILAVENVWLNRLSESDYSRLISYTNSKGIAFTTSVQDILTHVSLHGSYHRGQINAILRSEGYEPRNTDFITFTRLV